MTIRLRWGFIALTVLSGLAGCGGENSNSVQPTGSAPTVSGPVGGTITPIPSAAPMLASRAQLAQSPNTSSGKPASAPVLASDAASATTGRFTETVSDEAAKPAYSVQGGEYDLGSTLVSTAGATSSVFLARVHGWIRYPNKPLDLATAAPASYPIVIFLHGQHIANVPNFEGYDYMASDLAAHGYVALSIDANDINAACLSNVYGCGDYSSQSRGQLVLATLDRLKKLNDGTQTTNGMQLPSALIGKIDFDRIGIMGHSRGGQGINDAIQLNAQRVGVTLTQLRAAAAELRNEQESWASNVWFAAPGATETTGTQSAFLATLDSLNKKLAAKQLSDKDLLAELDKQNIMLSAGLGAGANAPPVYSFKAALSLAPTDSMSYGKIANVPFAALVGTCDGDVRNLSGTHVFDHNRFGKDSADTAPRFQIAVRGANHNYFNTQWTSDDYKGASTDYCYAGDKSMNPARLSANDQRSLGFFLINSFMRNFVGGETAFAPYWNGTARLPTSACPGGQAACDNRVSLTAQINTANGHKLIAPFDDHYAVNQLYDSATSTLQVGYPLDLIDASAFKRNVHTCATDFSLGDGAVPTCSPASPIGTFFRSTAQAGSMATYGGGLLSIANQVQFKLSAQNQALPITLKEPSYGATGQTVSTADLSTTGFDTLSFRIAMVRPISSVAGVPAAQHVKVTLTDSKGNTSSAIEVSDYSDALDSSMGLSIPSNGSMPELLNMVAIPLDAFKPDPATNSAFDIGGLKKLTLTFANAPNDGTAVALTDLQLQNFGRKVH